MKYQLIIFDSDGTLADTIPWMRSVFNDLAETHNFRKVAPEDHERFRDLTVKEMLKALELPLWKLPRVTSDMVARMNEQIDSFSLFEGIGDVLHRLSGAGIQLAIVSSNSRTNVEQILGPKNAGLINHFACGASIFGKTVKLRGVLRKTGFRPQHAIYIGDEIRDAEAARKTGIAFGAVGWGQHSAEILRAQNPAEFFNTVPQIVARLC